MSNNAPDYNDNLVFTPPASDMIELRKGFDDFLILLETILWADDDVVEDKLETVKNVIAEYRGKHK